MKNCLLVCVLGLVVLTGCARRYIVTLQNGSQMTAHGKPKLENNAYVFKDGSGQTRYVPVSRVREVAPSYVPSSPYSSDQSPSPLK